MNFPKLDIKQEKLDVNLKFYFFLKYIVKSKFTGKDVKFILQNYRLFLTSNDLDLFKQSVLQNFNQETKTAKGKYDNLTEIFIEINKEIDLNVLVVSFKIYLIKDLLLSEAKLKHCYDLEKLKDLHPLSLEYDKITVFNPYTTRVNGALLSLAFFDGLKSGFLCKTTDDFITTLSKEIAYLQKFGLEANQIFMLVFSESINQSIISSSGTDYENRILSVLVGDGINKESVQKVHDSADKSTEFDLFFELDGKKYGIGAKRTLRERYKQFIKTAYMTPIDVMIGVTLGADLTQEKAISIENHGIYLFVADEVYQTNRYMQEMKKIFSCKDLTVSTLKKLA